MVRPTGFDGFDGLDAFDEKAILADARSVDGLEDFGDEGFRGPLRVLLGALAEAPVHEIGAAILRGSVVRSLANRLRTEHWLARRPEIAEEVIEAPWVVVGMMRSGTTLLQRLLASDPRHFCTLGWETMEPAPRLDFDPAEPDPRIAVAEERDRAGRSFSPEVFAIHPSYTHEAEEEIVFLADAFLSHVPEASCDVPAYRSWLDDQDFTPAYRYLHRTLQLLQWQKKQRGQHGERWVLKTPAHLGYLDRLFDAFPDARVIHLHRDPVETIPSGASLNCALWRMVADDVDPRRVGRQWIERMAWTNRRAMAFREAEREAERGTEREAGAAPRFTDVGFRSAVADPIGQVEHVYATAGVALTPDARSAMQAWLERDARRKLPTHRYAPADFGLTEDEIREAFAEYTARFLAPQPPT